jgi:HEAT repeat protein
MGRVCGFNRTTAVRKAAKELARHEHLRTKPLRDLRAKLTALIDTPDDDLFCALVPAVWRDKDKRVPERLSRLLRSRSRKKQQIALSALRKLEYEGWPLLMEWASQPRDHLLVLSTLGPNLRLLPDARRAEIAKRALADESPTIRYEGAEVLSTLGPTMAAKLARQALKDDPDPLIRTKLSAFLPRRAAARINWGRARPPSSSSRAPRRPPSTPTSRRA